MRESGHAVESRLPIAPEWDVEWRGDHARCRHEDGNLTVEIRAEGGLAWSVEHGPFHPSFHREVERFVLVGRGVTALESRIEIRIV